MKWGYIAVQGNNGSVTIHTLPYYIVCEEMF